MAANPEQKCWTIQHVYANKYQDSDTFDKTAVYITAESAHNAICETIDEIEENINMDFQAPPTYLANKSQFTLDTLNNMIPNSFASEYMLIYENPGLIIAVVVRVLV